MKEKQPTRSEKIRQISGLNRTQFSKKYNIPLRSLEHWDAGDREPADYVFDLLERAVKEDFKS